MQAIPMCAGPLIQLNAADNVLIAREGLSFGASLSIDGTTARPCARVPAGHKIAARRIARGEATRKYNTIIRCAIRDIAADGHVHTHNVELIDYAHDPGFSLDVRPVDYILEAQRATFNGIIHPDGRVATRNFTGILASVNCLSTVIENVATWPTPERLALFPNMDDMVAFAQTSGCGISSSSEYSDVLCRTLTGYARHPNPAGVSVAGLGCERNQVADPMTSQGLKTDNLMYTSVMRDTDGTRATIEAGIAVIVKILPAASDIVRHLVSASHIKIGLKCGGSDGSSGIVVNPTLGVVMGLLVRRDDTAILSETPETYDMETILTRHTVSPGVGQKLFDRLAWWENYTRGHSGQFNGMVGPGNWQGGLANIFEKSLGSAMKGGTTPLQIVYKYAEPIDRVGFVLMDSLGYDLVAMTGQIVNGASPICLTVERGLMFDLKSTPTVKLASNTPVFCRFEEDMDISCGRILDGERSMEGVGQDIFEHILCIASGERIKNELLGLRDHEFVPWYMGIVS